MEERIYDPKFYSDEDLKCKSGIYQIRNLVNDKIYIGSSNNLYNRKTYGHLNALKYNRHENDKLQKAFNKYGKQNFTFEVIEFCEPEKRIEVEQYWIDRFYNKNMCYNINAFANKPPSNLGKHHSEETKQKISKIHKNKIVSLETRKKMSKIAKERFKNPKNNPMYGKQHSEKTKKKISSINMGNKYCLGRKLSSETKKKISEANKGRKLSPETIEKIKANNKNKKKIVRLVDNKIFNSKVECSLECGVSEGLLYSHCNNYLKTKPQEFMYYADYLKLTPEELQQKLNNLS